MPLTVKVQFKDKLYKLAHSTLTLQQVHHEMKQRFPHIDALRYFYQDKEVTDLASLLAAAAREGLSSVKLQARKDSAEISMLNEVSMVAESERNNSSIISLLAEEASKSQQMARFILPGEFYICYNC